MLPDNVALRTIVTIIISIILILTIASFIVASIVVNQNIEAGIFHQLNTLLNIDREANLPTWFSVILLFLTSNYFLIVAYHSRSQGKLYFLRWLFLGLFFIGFSIDEFVQLHELTNEPTRELLNTESFLYFAWVIPGMVLTLAVAAFYWKFILDLRWGTRNIFILASILYLGGVLGLEMIGGTYFALVVAERGKADFIYLVITHIEELMEMTGTTLYLYIGLLYTRMILQSKTAGLLSSH